MAIPYVTAGEVALAAEQNALIDQSNATTDLAASNETRLTTAEGDIGGIDSRLSTLESAPAARYYLATDQTGIVDGTDTRVMFDTVLVASPEVTASGTGNTTFTLNRDGWWAIDVGLRAGGVTFSGTPTGERLMAITNGGTAFSDRYVSHNDFVGSDELFSRPLSLARRFTAGAQISVTYKHFSGNDTGWVNGQGQGEQTSITFIWQCA